MEANKSQFVSAQDEEDSNALNRAAMTPRRLRKTTLPNTVEKLQEELRNIREDLEEKQRCATLAAQYGSTLLQTNDKLRSELVEMKTKLESAYDNMNELYSTLAEHNTQNVHLRTNNTVLSNQIRDAQKENQILLEELEQVKDLLDESQAKNRSIQALGDRKRELEEELEKFYGMNEKFEELSQRETFLTNKHKQLQQSYQQQTRELAEYRDEVVELSTQLETQKVDVTKVQTLTNQLQQVKRNVEQLKEEKRILEEMPLLSQFSETSTLRSLLMENRELLENLNFAKIEDDTKSIVDSLINNIADKGENEIGSKKDGKPTNAFYLLTTVLIQRKCEDLERRLQQDTTELQELRDEIIEIQSEKKSFELRIERDGRLKDKLEERMNELRLKHEENVAELEMLCEQQKEELLKLQELARSQSHAMSSTQMENEERMKRRIEELASLEVEYKTLQGKNSDTYEELKNTKNKLQETQNRNSEFQEVIRKLNIEKGELAQQVSTAQRDCIALQHTKESQQEMLETVRNQYRAQVTTIGQLQGDLANLQEVHAVAEEQIDLGKEELDLLQKHNELLQSQVKKDRERFAKQTEKYTLEIQELNELIQMMQSIEEEQLELESQAATEDEGTEQTQSTLRRENMDLKKRLHDTRMELSLIESEKQLLEEQLQLLQEDIEFEKYQREQDRTDELKLRKVLNDQIDQLQERLKRAEASRLQEITNLETLKKRTFNDLQQQLIKEQSINQSNTTKVKRLVEQTRELDIANRDLVASMAMMIKDSGEECQRIDELEDQLRASKIRHKDDARTILRLQKQIQLLQGRMHLKRPYLNTLPPPNPLVIPDFPLTEIPISTQVAIQSEVSPSKEDKNEEEKEKNEIVDIPEAETEKEILKDVVEHIRGLLAAADTEILEKQAYVSSLMLCKLINQVVPGTIDERAINPLPKDKQEEIQNLNLCLNSAKAIGCDVPNIQASDLADDPTQLEQLTWEIVRTELLSNVSLRKHPELVQLQQDMELQAQIVDIQSLTPQELLLHWVNHHLSSTNEELQIPRISNFETDLQNLNVHYGLLKQLCKLKEIPTSHIPTWEADTPWEERAKIVTQLAESLDTKLFLFPNEIQSCNQRLNVAFLSNVLHAHSGLQLLHPVIMTSNEDVEQVIEEDHGTREERAFRLWINSLGIGTYVHNLQTDVRDGLILLKVFDVIAPGTVQWTRVNKDPKRMGMYRKVENCTLCIKYGRDLGFSLVGIGGKDIFDGNRKFILALVWQMMQLHLLSILRQVSEDKTKKVTEKDVVSWANQKISHVRGSEGSIDTLRSEKLQNSLFLAQLMDIVCPGSINFDFITTNQPEMHDLEQNAKYVISVARKIGCCIFLVWEDIVELNHKMIFTLVATLMLRDSHNFLI